MIFQLTFSKLHIFICRITPPSHNCPPQR